MAQNRVDDEVEALLKQTIRSRLEASGELNKIKSEMRAMVLNDIRNGDKAPMSSCPTKDAQSPTQVANHLVKEYLEWIGFQYTSDMFVTESGCDSEGKSRDYVEAKTNVKDFDKELPLLITVAMKLMKGDEKK